MYEIAVALKYLLPRWRQLSVSIIGLISIFVISVVVWLSIVFFSTEESIVQRWTQKLIAVTAPCRLTPTPEYYNSYYYRIDAFSEKSQFTPKSLYEKLVTEETDPYNPTADPSLTPFFVKPLHNAQGALVDLVKEAKRAVESIPGVSCWPFESAFANVRISMNRYFFDEVAHETVAQSTYVTNIDPINPELGKALLPIHVDDINNLFHVLYTPSQTGLDEERQRLLNDFFKQVTIESFRTPATGFVIPPSFIPEESKLFCIVTSENGHIVSLLLPRSTRSYAVPKQDSQMLQTGFVSRKGKTLFFNETPLSTVPIYVEAGTEWNAVHAGTLFDIRTDIQGETLQGIISPAALHVHRFHVHEGVSTFWISQDPKTDEWHLAHNRLLGYGVLLPKSFRESGVAIGDTGALLYNALQATAMQEMRLPIFVAGFYDPGIMPIGGRLLIAPQSVVSQIRASLGDDVSLPTGFNVHFANYKKAPQIKQQIISALKAKNIDQFWHTQTYDTYEFTRDIFQQMQSDRNLFTMISIIIIIVACSNIISMLIILVHDKRKEIAVLRALGATRLSIGVIFGICGFFMGAIGSIIGSLLALVTLYNLPYILQTLSAIQGFDVFNSAFYGNLVTATISPFALWFVLLTTSSIATIAGIIPAIKAAFMNTSEALRNE